MAKGGREVRAADLSTSAKRINKRASHRGSLSLSQRENSRIGAEEEMCKLYLLFKTDDIQKEIVAAHESLDVIVQFLKDNPNLAEPEKLGQGWEIDWLTYDATGKTNLKPIKKYSKVLVNCSPDDIEAGAYYNIVHRDIQGSSCLNNTRRVFKAKCIKASPPEYIFSKGDSADWHLDYKDIIVITKSREDEDGDDCDRFIYYSHLYEWEKEHGD